MLKKCCKEKHVDLLLIGEEAKRHYVFTKDFNTFISANFISASYLEENIFVAIAIKLLI